MVVGHLWANYGGQGKGRRIRADFLLKGEELNIPSFPLMPYKKKKKMPLTLKKFKK